MFVCLGWFPHCMDQFQSSFSCWTDQSSWLTQWEQGAQVCGSKRRAKSWPVHHPTWQVDWGVCADTKLGPLHFGLIFAKDIIPEVLWFVQTQFWVWEHPFPAVSLSIAGQQSVNIWFYTRVHTWWSFNQVDLSKQLVSTACQVGSWFFNPSANTTWCIGLLMMSLLSSGSCFGSMKCFWAPCSALLETFDPARSETAPRCSEQ